MIPSKHLHFNSPKIRRPRLTPRELAVVSIAGILLALMPWAWGGVVLWCVYFTFGLALSALIAAIGDYKTQITTAFVWFGVLVYRAWSVPEGAAVASSFWLEATAFPLAALFGQIVAAALLRDDIKSRSSADSFHALIRTPIFWIGLILFSYFAIQDLNAWGVVVERDIFWRIGKLNPIKWLPSGLKAPFASEEMDPGGMNAWRTILIFAGPWLLFCALRVGLLRRRGYVFLGWVTVITAVIIAGFGFTNQPVYGEKAMGFPVPAGAAPFGPFIYRNHAGVYFYLQAAIAVALGFWHFRRSRNSATHGSPHLLAAFVAMLLVAASFLTYSVAASVLALTLIVFIAPIAYFSGMPSKIGEYSRRSSLTLVAVLGLVFAILFSANFKKLENKATTKLQQYSNGGSDGRAPLRASTYKMATADGAGRLWLGWGAGSYRWVSPYFQAQEKELQNAKGKLDMRATYAHCDWLQILAEWGIVGFAIVMAGVIWFFTWSAKTLKRGHPEAIPLAGAFVLFLFNMGIDFPIWFTPLLFSVAFIAAMMISLVDDSLREGDKSE
jgi:O-antigen ligase